MSSLWENSRIRDNNCFYNSKTLSVFFFTLRFRRGESTFLGSETCRCLPIAAVTTPAKLSVASSVQQRLV